jgi:hypothetical protein
VYKVAMRRERYTTIFKNKEDTRIKEQTNNDNLKKNIMLEDMNVSNIN